MSPVRHRFVDERGWLGFGYVGGLLVFLSLGGLLIRLLPFGGFAQVSVLLHTALGIAGAAAFGVWQLSHWLATRKAPRKRRKISAYVGFWLLAASFASGFVITWQAVFGLYASHLWAQIHLWTGVLSLPFLAYHVIPERDPSAAGAVTARPSAELRTARRRMWILAAAVSGVLLATTGVLTTVAGRPVHRTVGAVPHGADPFAPSNVTTGNGRPVPVELLANSESCGVSGCHTAIYEEWRADAHRWSAEDQFFQTVRGVVTELHGRTVTEKCAGCHDPVSILSGHKDPNLGTKSPGYHGGDSCVVCHAVKKVDERGIGSYMLGFPTPYLFEESTAPLARSISHFLIRVFPAQHSRDYSLEPVRRPDSCAPCHKEYDVIVEQQGPVQVETQYDDWKQGKWNTDPVVKQRLYCQQCHMYYLEAPHRRLADPYDLRVGLGLKHRNHYFAAGNQHMPQTLGAPDAAGQVQRVTEWLEGKREVPEISKVWPRGPVVALKILAAQSAKSGGNISFQVSLTNAKVGHGFPTGPLNIVRAWIEVRVEDGAGEEVFHSGRLDAENHIEAGSYILKPLAIDLAGHMVMGPELWHPQGPQYRPAVSPGQSATYDYRFQAPAGAPGPLRIRARLRYRKANQFFMDSVYPDEHRTAPVTDISSGEAEIAFSSQAGPAPGRRR